MESLGQQFKQAREAQKMSLSEAAAATRIMMHQLEAIENDNWSKIPAPAYAKGFIKIYAQQLGLDAAPLTRQYEEQFVNPVQEPDLLSAQPPHPGAASAAAPHAGGEQGEGVSAPALTVNPEWVRHAVYIIAGLLLVFFLGLFTVRSCDKIKAQRPEKPVSELAEVKSTLVAEPPEPYLDLK